MDLRFGIDAGLGAEPEFRQKYLDFDTTNVKDVIVGD